MQTAYDNFWMYQNNRHEPVHNLQKSDNYSYAVLTDRYKSVQNGVHPRDSNSFIPPQNNVTSSLQNDRHRTTAAHWPTSTYFQSSYPNNFYTQNAYASESNNLNYLSQNTQSQQNCGMRYPQNHNVNVAHTSGSNHANTVISGSNENTPRIRVKDVFSLNNNSLHDPLLRSNTYQTHFKKQDEYFTNYGRCKFNKTAISEAQSEFIDIQKLFAPRTGPPPFYNQTTQFHKQSNSVYQENGEYSHEIQLQNARTRVLGKSARVAAPKKNTSLLRKILFSEVNLGEKAQSPKTNSSDVSWGNSREKVLPNTPSAEINGPEVDPNRRLIQRTPILGKNVQQLNISNNVEAHLLNHNSVTTAMNSTYQTTPNQTTHLYNQLEMPLTTIKITIPHTGESSYIRMNTTLNTENSSGLSLPCSLKSNNTYLSPGNKENPNKVNREEKSFTLSPPQTAEGNLNNNQALSLVNGGSKNFHISSQSQPPTDNRSRDTVITSQKKITHIKDPLIDVNRDNIIKFLNSNSRTSVDSVNENVPRETVLHNILSSSALTSKRENIETNEEKTPDRNISEENLRQPVIKMEEYTAEDIPDESDEEECKTEVSEEEKFLGVSVTTSAESNEPVGLTFSEDIVPSAEELTAEPLDVAQASEICIRETDISENHFTKRSNSPTDENSCQEQQEETCLDQTSYKCKINRDKLDKLIQFIKKDDEKPARPISSTSPADRTGDNNKDKGEVDVIHNRRKLSKTCIVKNKNNSREMVSLLSHKIARGEVLKNSAQSPQSLLPCDTNSEKSEEDFSDGNIKTDGKRKCQENQTQKDDLSKSESGDTNGSIRQHVEGCSYAKSPELICDFQEEKDVINTIRALQNLETHFCMSCNFSSPINSFWINVASAELRCLNCFKKMTLKNDSHIYNTKTSDCNVNGFDRKSAEKDERNENLEKDSDELKSTEKEQRQERVDLGEQIESEEARKEKTVIKSKHNSSKDNKTSERGIIYEIRTEKSEEQSTKKCNVKEDSHKVRSLENNSKTDTCGKIKSKDLVSNEEPQNSEKLKNMSSKSHSSSHSKQVSESSDKKIVKAKEHTVKNNKILTSSSNEVLGKSIRRSLSKEEEINDQRKDSKSVTDSAEKSGKRTREIHTFHKDRNAEQPKTSKPKSQSPSKECCTCQKMKSSEQSNPNEMKSKSISGSNSDKNKRVEQPRKRKKSEEGSIPNKVRIVEDHSKREKKQVQQPSDKSKVSKDEVVSHKSKILDNEKTKSSSEKLHRHSFTKEEDEHSKKDIKVSDSSDKSKGTHHKIKAEFTKLKINDSTDEKVRKKSREDNDTSKPITSKEHTKSESKQTSELSGGQSRKNYRKEESDSFKKEERQGSSVTEAKEKRYEKERERKQFVGKIPKLSEKDKAENFDRSRKSDRTSKPLKESQNNKIKSSFLSDKKNKEFQEENYKNVKDILQKRPDAIAKEAERIAEKIKSAGKNHENWHMKGLTESSASVKRKKESSTLFAKLMQKTKKLSLSLLSES